MQTQKTVSTVSVNIMKRKEIIRDDHLSQTFGRPWQNQLCHIDYWIKTSLTYFLVPVILPYILITIWTMNSKLVSKCFIILACAYPIL